MRLLRGSGAGELVTPGQWANDWISHDRVEFRSGIASPRNVQLTEKEEFDRFRESQGDPGVGQFWMQWELLEDGTFRQRADW